MMIIDDNFSLDENVADFVFDDNYENDIVDDDDDDDDNEDDR